MNFTREELYKIYQEVPARTYNPYVKKFTEGNAAIFSEGVRIHMEDMIAEMEEAEIFDRDSAIPAIKGQSHSRLSITPPLVGGKAGLSALDGIEKRVGEVVLTDGSVVDNSVYELNTKLTRLKSRVVNTLGALCAEVFLTGKVEHDGLVDYGDTGATLNVKGKKLHLELVKLVRGFYKEYGYVPKISIGDGIVARLIEEYSHVGVNKAGKHDYQMIKTDQGFNFMISGMTVEMEVLAPANKYWSKAPIDTDNLIILHVPQTLVMAYAVLETVDASGKPMLVRGETVVNYGLTNPETGRSSVHVKSAPLPVVVDNRLIQRYKVTLA